MFGTCSLFETIFDVHLLMMSQGVRHVIAVRQDAEVLDHKVGAVNVSHLVCCERHNDRPSIVFFRRPF